MPLLEGIWGLVSTNPIILVVFILILLYVAYRIFKIAIKMVFIAIAGAILPFVLNMLGMGIEISLSSMLSFALLAVVLYFAYSSMRTGLKIVGFVFSPFKKLFGGSAKVHHHHKEKVIVKEVESKKDKKKRYSH